MKFSIKDFLSECDQIQRKLRLLSHLLKKSLMENLFFVHCKQTVLGFLTTTSSYQVTEIPCTICQLLKSNAEIIPVAQLP